MIDIRKGDTIESSYTNGGVTYSRRGIAHHQDMEGDWCTAEGTRLTGQHPAEVVTILHRPKPPLPTSPMPQIRALKVRGVEGNWLMAIDAEGDWFAFDENGSVIIGDATYHKPHHIEEWEFYYPTDSQ